MTSFESSRPRTSRAQARLRERELKQQLERLLEAGDEETFKAGLAKDFGIERNHPRFEEMIKIWRDGRASR